MHLAGKMYRDVTNMEIVKILDEFFDKTFIRHLMLGKEEARSENGRMHVLHENFALTRWYAFIKLHPTSAFDDS